MPKDPRHFILPRLNYIIETVRRSHMTDGGSTAGTYQLAGQIPVGAEVLATQVRVLSPFSGDSSATITVGDGSDVDRYNTGTPSVFAAAANGVAMGLPSGARYHAAGIRPTITITSGADFTNVASGELVVCIAFIEFPLTFPNR
jgi:hypothetical protein